MAWGAVEAGVALFGHGEHAGGWAVVPSRAGDTGGSTGGLGVGVVSAGTAVLGLGGVGGAEGALGATVTSDAVSGVRDSRVSNAEEARVTDAGGCREVRGGAVHASSTVDHCRGPSGAVVASNAVATLGRVGGSGVVGTARAEVARGAQPSSGGSFACIAVFTSRARDARGTVLASGIGVVGSGRARDGVGGVGGAVVASGAESFGRSGGAFPGSAEIARGAGSSGR